MPLVGGATSEGGNVYQWLWRDLLRETADLDAQLLARPPAAHGLVVLPLLAGERAPGWQADASGTIHGLRRSTSRLDLLQAHLEAVALRLSLIYQQLESPGVDCAGWAAARCMLRGLGRRCWPMPLLVPSSLLTESEVTARGVALTDAAQPGRRIALDAEPPQISRIAQPVPARVEAMRVARDTTIRPVSALVWLRRANRSGSRQQVGCRGLPWQARITFGPHRLSGNSAIYV